MASPSSSPHLTRRQRSYATAPGAHNNPSRLEPFSAGALVPNHERGSLQPSQGGGGRNRRRGSPFAALSEVYKPPLAAGFAGRAGGRDRGEVLGLRSSNFSWPSSVERLPADPRHSRRPRGKKSSAATAAAAAGEGAGAETEVTTAAPAVASGANRPPLLVVRQQQADENAVESTSSSSGWFSSWSSSSSSKSGDGVTAAAAAAVVVAAGDNDGDDSSVDTASSPPSSWLAAAKRAAAAAAARATGDDTEAAPRTAAAAEAGTAKTIITTTTTTAPPSPSLSPSSPHRRSVSWGENVVHEFATNADQTQADVYSPDLLALEIAKRLAVLARDPELRRAASAVELCRRHAGQTVRSLAARQSGGVQGVEDACRLCNWRESAFLRETDELVRCIVVAGGQKEVWRLKASYRTARRQMEHNDSE